MPKPSAETLEKRRLVGVNPETVSNVTSKDIPGHYPDEDHAWDVDDFRKTFRVQFHRNEPNEAIFSLIGIDASLANALRRILLANIPTLAIEHVFVEQNTSIIQDEVMAQRLGLIPLAGNKKGLRRMKWREKPTEEDPSSGSPASDLNTVVMNLDVKCAWKAGGEERSRRGETDSNVLYQNAHVYARQLTFEPIGLQTTAFSAEAGPVRPVHPDILLAKLRPGQSISMRLHAELGNGADHAKFSPVATATYRLLPDIKILQPILGDDAVKFQKCFPKGVIGLDKVSASESKKKGTALEGRQGDHKAVVRNPFKDTVTRECLRHKEFQEKVKLGRYRDHFIFSVESTGQWDSHELLIDAIKCLKYKCQRVKREFARIKEAEG